MISEDYNGVCPHCEYERCLVRYGSIGYFQFFACPNCEFCFGHNSEKDFSKEEVWKSIIEAHKDVLDEKGFFHTITGLKMLVETFDEPENKVIIEEKNKFWEWFIDGDKK